MKKSIVLAGLVLLVLLATPIVHADETEGGVTVLQMGEAYATQERVDFVFAVGAFGATLGIIAFAFLMSRKRED